MDEGERVRRDKEMKKNKGRKEVGRRVEGGKGEEEEIVKEMERRTGRRKGRKKEGRRET